MGKSNNKLFKEQNKREVIGDSAVFFIHIGRRSRINREEREDEGEINMVKMRCAY